MAGTIRNLAESQVNHPYFLSGRVVVTALGNISAIDPPGAGYQLLLHTIAATNTSATDAYVDIMSLSTIIWTVPIPAGGGCVLAFKFPIPCAANEGMYLSASAAVTSLIICVGAERSRIVKTP